MNRRVLTGGAGAGFAALCLLSASGWILNEALVSPLPGILEFASATALLGGGCAVAAKILHKPRIAPRATLQIIAWSAVVFLLPILLLLGADGAVSSTTVVLIYTLIPAATIFLRAQQSDNGSLTLLGPALAGVMGAALILPFAVPSSRAGTFWLLAFAISAVLVAMGSIRLHGLTKGNSLLCIIPLASVAPFFAGALVASLHRVANPTTPASMLIVSLLCHLTLTGAIFSLTVWLLRAADPIRLSSRFLIAPLLTILEGYGMLRPPLTWTLVAGILLLAGGSLLLLRRGHQS